MIVFVLYLILLVFSYIHPMVSNRFLSCFVVAMTTCVFVLMRDIPMSDSVYSLLKKVSHLTFGIYLVEMVVFRCVTIHLYRLLGTGWHVQCSVMIATFILSLLATMILSKIPYKRYIIG